MDWCASVRQQCWLIFFKRLPTWEPRVAPIWADHKYTNSFFELSLQYPYPPPRVHLEIYITFPSVHIEELVARIRLLVKAWMSTFLRTTVEHAMFTISEMRDLPLNNDDELELDLGFLPPNWRSKFELVSLAMSLEEPAQYDLVHLRIRRFFREKDLNTEERFEWIESAWSTMMQFCRKKGMMTGREYLSLIRKSHKERNAKIAEIKMSQTPILNRGDLSRA